MSLSKSHSLNAVAKKVARDLRKRQTDAERLLWEHLRNRKLHGRKFLRQHPIFHDLLGKETFYVADFYCGEARLVVEVDGPIHGYQKTNDELRTSIINDLGITVIRFANERIENDIQSVLQELAKHLPSR
jgi:very-short-patch-repair endonuclease